MAIKSVSIRIEEEMLEKPNEIDEPATSYQRAKNLREDYACTQQYLTNTLHMGHEMDSAYGSDGNEEI